MLIEANLTRVQQALTVLNSALANGIDWDQLATMVVAQKRAGNPVALIIHQCGAPPCSGRGRQCSAPLLTPPLRQTGP